jgi:hypothetical protein
VGEIRGEPRLVPEGADAGELAAVVQRGRFEGLCAVLFRNRPQRGCRGFALLSAILRAM